MQHTLTRDLSDSPARYVSNSIVTFRSPYSNQHDRNLGIQSTNENKNGPRSDTYEGMSPARSRRLGLKGLRQRPGY